MRILREGLTLDIRYTIIEYSVMWPKRNYYCVCACSGVPGVMIRSLAISSLLPDIRRWCVSSLSSSLSVLLTEPYE